MATPEEQAILDELAAAEAANDEAREEAPDAPAPALDVGRIRRFFDAFIRLREQTKQLAGQVQAGDRAVSAEARARTDALAADVEQARREAEARDDATRGAVDELGERVSRLENP